MHVQGARDFSEGDVSLSRTGVKDIQRLVPLIQRRGKRSPASGALPPNHYPLPVNGEPEYQPRDIDQDAHAQRKPGQILPVRVFSESRKNSQTSHGQDCRGKSRTRLNQSRL